MRNENKLKGSLDSIVSINANDKDLNILKKLGNELHFLFIASEVTVKKSKNLKIKINSSKKPKCTRCWHRHDSVGTRTKHPELCYRCIENIDGSGEQRSFV